MRRWLLAVVALTVLLPVGWTYAAVTPGAYYQAVSKAHDLVQDADSATDEACGPQAWPPQIVACVKALTTEQQAVTRAESLVEGVHLAPGASAGALGRDAAMRRALPPLRSALAGLVKVIKASQRSRYLDAQYARLTTVTDFTFPASAIAADAPDELAGSSSSDLMSTLAISFAIAAALMALIGIVVGLIQSRSAEAERALSVEAHIVLPPMAPSVTVTDPLERLALVAEAAVEHYRRRQRKGFWEHPFVVTMFAGAGASLVVTLVLHFAKP
jgi:hypothetical protein